jgi:hypothetical protein
MLERAAQDPFANQPNLGVAGESAHRLVVKVTRILTSEHQARIAALQVQAADH